jgi:hypothetical protein
VDVHLDVSRRLAPRSALTRDENFGWCVDSADGDLLALDDRLRDIARFRLPEDALGKHGISPDRQTATVSARSRVVVVDRAGSTVWEVPHASWGGGDSQRGSCWFSADGRFVWAHVPTDDGPDEWLLLGAKSGTTAGRVRLSCYSAGSDVIRHPDGNHVGLSVGEGQDGSETYFGRVQGGSPAVDRLDDRSRVLVAFSPDGDRFLTTAHSSGPLQLHRSSDHAVVAALEPEAAFDGDDAFDFFGGFVGPELMLFTSVESDDVFVASVPDLGDVQRLQVPMRRAGDPLFVIPGGFLVSDPATGETTVWRLTG